VVGATSIEGFLISQCNYDYDYAKRVTWDVNGTLRLMDAADEPNQQQQQQHGT